MKTATPNNPHWRAALTLANKRAHATGNRHSVFGYRSLGDGTWRYGIARGLLRNSAAAHQAAGTVSE